MNLKVVEWKIYAGNFEENYFFALLNVDWCTLVFSTPTFEIKE